MNFFVIGDVTVDHIYHLENLPELGEEVQPLFASLQPGGAGGTISTTLARLGHKVTLGASVGNDVFADFALNNVKNSGVLDNCLQVFSSQPTSAITIIQTKDGNRTMISYGGVSRSLNPSKLRKKDIERCDALIISAYSLIEGDQLDYTVKAIEIAKKLGIIIFMDLGSGAVNKAGTALLEHVLVADYLTLNQKELLDLTNKTSMSEALVFLSEKGIKNIVIKVGSLGCIVWTPKDSELVDSILPQNEQVVDATGAGDVFTAIFAHAITSGLNLKKSSQMANIAGGLATTAVGAQSKVITLEELLEYS